MYNLDISEEIYEFIKKLIDKGEDIIFIGRKQVGKSAVVNSCIDKIFGNDVELADRSIEIKKVKEYKVIKNTYGKKNICILYDIRGISILELKELSDEYILLATYRNYDLNIMLNKLIMNDDNYMNGIIKSKEEYVRFFSNTFTYLIEVDKSHDGITYIDNIYKITNIDRELELKKIVIN